MSHPNDLPDRALVRALAASQPTRWAAGGACGYCGGAAAHDDACVWRRAVALVAAWDAPVVRPVAAPLACRHFDVADAPDGWRCTACKQTWTQRGAWVRRHAWRCGCADTRDSDDGACDACGHLAPSWYERPSLAQGHWLDHATWACMCSSHDDQFSFTPREHAADEERCASCHFDRPVAVDRPADAPEAP